MPGKQPNKPRAEVQRVKLTARVTLPARDAVTEIQQRHLRKTGTHLPVWQILDAAIIAYARRQKIPVEE